MTLIADTTAFVVGHVVGNYGVDERQTSEGVVFDATAVVVNSKRGSVAGDNAVRHGNRAALVEQPSTVFERN